MHSKQSSGQIGGKPSDSKNRVVINPIYRATDPLQAASRPPYNRSNTGLESLGDGGSSTYGETGVHSSVISHHETKRRVKGEPVII